MKFIDAFRMHMRPAGDGHNRSLCGKVRRYLRLNLLIVLQLFVLIKRAISVCWQGLHV
ncbi:hypothetical protein KP509_14G058000 [Ceratopteris richardii]|uniref:Uncharacterized protein n=1 Tax=Ceratopteris richardii TaxID=49495 RepID=A0A8T2T893_CERRI|nr:hypothetical protein KP509_14G058000 [Ceratopteris richardii]